MQAVWVLGRVAFGSQRGRDLVLAHGGLFPLLRQLNEHAELSMLRIATWTLGTFCQPPSNFDDQVAIWGDNGVFLVVVLAK